MNQIKYMLLTVGGTAEPIIKSIEKYQPENIYFLASQKTSMTAHQVYSSLSYKPSYKLDLIDNENDLIECFEKYNKICLEIKEKINTPSEVVIDYTGGTKNMTAGLVLASSGKGFTFSYVGGNSRTKDGTGIVISGNEEIYNKVDPFEFFKIETKRKLKEYFNEFKFEQALELSKQLSELGNEQDKSLYAIMTDIITAYMNWDKFKHKDAKDSLNKGIARIEALIPYNKHLKPFIDNCKINLEFLNNLMTSIKNDSKVSDLLVLDIFSNSERRYKENRYDDSVARIYRTLEMIAQVEFFKEFKFSTSKVPLDKIPEDLQEEYKKYIDDDSNNLKFGSHATFKVLENIKNKAGIEFMDKNNNFESMLRTRNNSILAHGSNPIDRSTNEKFLEKIKTCFNLENYPVFPKLPDL